MYMNKKLLGAAGTAAAILLSPSVYATNGYFLPGFGIRSMGMGGVGIASGEDAISAAANPANLAKVGSRVDVGLTLFNPERSSNVYGSSPFGFHGGGSSDNTLYPMPEFGLSQVYSPNLTLGMAMVGNGGMNTTYRNNFFNYPLLSVPGQNTTVGVDLMQVLIPLSAAFKVNETQTVGASVVLAVQRFAARGLEAFSFFDTHGFNVTSDPNSVTGKGFDWSYGGGLKLGWEGDYFDRKLTVGAAWASKTYMTRFKKYQGLFAEHGDFDIPENYGLGFALRPNDKWTVAFDITEILYSQVPSVGNPGMSTPLGVSGVPSMNNPIYELGNPQGMGFGWSNQTIYKLGVEFAATENLKLRAGYNYGKSPIKNDQVTFSLLAPATVQEHYSVGFTYKPKKDMEITGDYMYVAPHTQWACGQNLVDCAKISMYQNYLGVNLSWLY